MSDAAVICKYAPNALNVRWGQRCSRGPLDLEDREGQDTSGLIVRERVQLLRVPAADFEGLTRGETIVVRKASGDVSYVVREVELAEDGEIMEVLLT